MHKNNNKFKSIIVLSILAFGVSALSLSSSTFVQAEYKADIGRYDDVLSAAAPEAIYNYSYENTSSSTAPGYFELSLEKLAGSKASDLLEVKSITETSPIDYSTKKPAEGAKTTEFKVSDAVYNDGDTLKIRISPQSECKVRPEGGCADGMIPAATPAKISIKVALKANAPTSGSVFYGSGRLFFPSGFDANQISWKINVGNADESAVTLPTNKENAPDIATLETNQALIKSQTATTTTPAVLEIGKNEVSKSASLNAQNVEASPNSSKTTVEKPTVENNNLLYGAGAAISIALIAGIALYVLNMRKKASKTK